MVTKLDEAMGLLRSEQECNIDNIEYLRTRNLGISGELADAEKIKANINQLVGKEG